MNFAIWSLVLGALFIIMALSGSLLKRLPVSIDMVYLAAGFGLGPAGLGLMSPDPMLHSVILERLTEVALLISLFASGMKLGLPLSDKRWFLPLRLATTSMMLTIALLAFIGILGLGLSVGAALLLGAILAPTDPVLASNVQVEHAGDRDRLRFSLTGEGGLNDGAAFPFVMLGLGLLGLHDLGTSGWRWFTLDLLWSMAAGLLIGAALGTLIGKLVVYLRTRHREAVGLDEFLALGLIALAYGVASMLYASGFLAVFAAGFALQRMGKGDQNMPAMAPVLQNKKVHEDIATDVEHAGPYMMQAVRGFNEQLESIAEFMVVLIVGAMLSYTYFPVQAIWLLPLLFLLVRPLSVGLGLMGAEISREQKLLSSWFGIRGIGSIFYLVYAINHGLSTEMAKTMVALTLTVVVASIFLHGLSMTPLMNLYGRRKSARKHKRLDTSV
jgi:NhaP-type Na+/H+ or K+/H+ antiporter